MKAFFTSSAVSSSSGSGEQPAIINSLAGSSAEQPVCEAKPMPQSTHYPKPPPPELPDYDYQNCTEQTVREAKPMPQSTCLTTTIKTVTVSYAATQSHRRQSYPECVSKWYLQSQESKFRNRYS